MSGRYVLDLEISGRNRPHGGALVTSDVRLPLVPEALHGWVEPVDPVLAEDVSIGERSNAAAKDAPGAGRELEA